MRQWLRVLCVLAIAIALCGTVAHGTDQAQDAAVEVSADGSTNPDQQADDLKQQQRAQEEAQEKHTEPAAPASEMPCMRHLVGNYEGSCDDCGVTGEVLTCRQCRNGRGSHSDVTSLRWTLCAAGGEVENHDGRLVCSEICVDNPEFDGAPDQATLEEARLAAQEKLRQTQREELLRVKLEAERQEKERQQRQLEAEKQARLQQEAAQKQAEEEKRQSQEQQRQQEEAESKRIEQEEQRQREQQAAAESQRKAQESERQRRREERQRMAARCSALSASCHHGSPDETCEVCICLGGWSGETCDSCPLKCSKQTVANARCDECVCRTGFEGNDALGCKDIDECAIDNGGCDEHVGCLNTLGSFKCGSCPRGFVGSGYSKCFEVAFVALATGLFVVMVTLLWCFHGKTANIKI